MKRSVPRLLIIATLIVAGCGTPDRTPATPATPGPGAAASAGAGGATAASTTGAVVRGWSTAPRFRGRIAPASYSLRGRLRWSWRPGCPVGPGRLQLLQADHWGFDRRVHRGELVVHQDHARRILGVLEKLFNARYPIQRMHLVDAYRADDDRSMAANNTSAFNCRRVSRTSRWSEHAFGRAIDVNPLQNPYVTGSGRVSPPAGRPYANRARGGAAMIRPGDKVVRAFAAAGWRWGGYWSRSRDYQHFSATGR
jgi:D-alanyl-D-alanine carboxypeptidase